MGRVSRPKIADTDGLAAVRAAATGDPARPVLALACRYLLQELGERYPGHAVEVRVPPFGAVQCIPGPRHTRGTPPNVIEMAPTVWIELATGRTGWDQAAAAGLVRASGVRASLEGFVPLVRPGR